MSFRTLARIVGVLTLIGGDKIVTFKFPSPLEDLGESNVETGLNETKTSLFPYPREDFLGGLTLSGLRNGLRHLCFRTLARILGGLTMDSALLAHWACAFPYPCED